MPQPQHSSKHTAKPRRKRPHRPKRSPLGLFSKLPQELREIIYRHAFAAGSVSLTRTSSALHQNTRTPLLQHGIYRLHLESRIFRRNGPGSHYRWFTRTDNAIPSEKILTKVRDMRLRISVCKQDPGCTWTHIVSAPGNKPGEIMRRLGNAIQRGRHCEIRLDRLALELFAARMMEGLKLLLRFETVTVEIWDCWASWANYVEDPEGDTHAVRAGIRRVLGLKEGGEEGPEFTFVRHPPKDFYTPCGEVGGVDED